MEACNGLPVTPTLPSRADAVDWVVALDVDQTNPTGYPFRKNVGSPWE